MKHFKTIFENKKNRVSSNIRGIKKRVLVRVATMALVTLSFFHSPLLAYAEVDYNAEAEARKSLPIQSNEIENWPAGPAIGAQSAILMEATTGTILYAKNIDERLYPASVTKLMTCLIAAENSSMEELVVFSDKAVHSINWLEDSNMGIKVGDEITMEQALYGVLVGSANEAANAVAEHISGSIEDFVVLMNQRAKELGCTNTNFVTTNGIHDDAHYTSAHDLALIAQAFFSYDILCKMSSTCSYQVPQTATQPNEAMIVNTKNQIFEGKAYAYEYLVGSKTGYTSLARQTLVSCAKKDGMTLVCVILKEESPNQYVDTIDLFNYGFSNFSKYVVADIETEYSIESSDFFNTDQDVFGDSSPILSLNTSDYIILPNTASFEEATSNIIYDDTVDASIATIHYTYNGVAVGDVSVDVTLEDTGSFDFDSVMVTQEPVTEDTESVIFINVKKVIYWVLGISGFLIIVIIIRSVIDNYHFEKRKRARQRRKRQRRIHSEFDDFDF